MNTEIVPLIPALPLPQWSIATAPVPYPEALRQMQERVTLIQNGGAEWLWALEHPPLYTAGTSARAADLIDHHRFPVFAAGRGGQYTYHGPGQRVVYTLLDLNRRGRDVRQFVSLLEAWIIATLAEFNVKGERRAGRVGVWVSRTDKPAQPDGSPREDKIAAIGVKLSKWVSFHGISINVDPDLEHFSGIIPCGIREHGVTSLVDLGLSVSMADVDLALQATFAAVFRI